MHTMKEYVKSLSYVLLGVAIGWSCDFMCVCNGESMLPTIHPGERIAFIPYSVLCLKQMLFKLPLVHQGDVVVMKISNDVCVCKRVVKMTTSRAEAREWCKERFIDYEYVADNLPAEPYGTTVPAPANDYGESTWLANETRQPRSHQWDACIERNPNPKAWLWLEGDNKPNSFDSRQCGGIPVECLRGRVYGALWPKPHWIR